MRPLIPNFSLPQLQAQLDQLDEGALFQISGQDYRRLFGENDIARERLLHFAKGHSCVISHANEAIMFRKKFTESKMQPLSEKTSWPEV